MPESSISLPADVTDALSLRRTLSAIVDQINIIIGAKGVDPYVKASDLPAEEVTLDTLNKAIVEVKEALAVAVSDFEDVSEAIEELQTAITLLSNVVEYDQATSAMVDFNDTSWSELKGLYQFSDLGENLVNPPEATSTGVTYNVYAQSFETLGGGVVQEVVIENTDTNEVKEYKRAGDSFATATTNGWIL